MTKLRQLGVYVLIGIGTIYTSYYMTSILFFGDNSLKIYNELKVKKEILAYEVKKLQLENEKLLKDYFEYKLLEPE